MELLRHDFLPSGVSQLAKPYNPTLKVLPVLEKPVGRQQEKQPRTHSRIYTGIDKTKPQLFKLSKFVKNDFIQTIPLLFDFTENSKVIFHNTDFVDAVFSTYHTEDAFVFLEWVKTFAIMRIDNREIVFDGVIESNDSDFLRAFRLLKLQAAKVKKASELKRKRKKKKQKQQIWELILKHFPKQPFSTKQIYEKTLIERRRVRRLLHQLIADNKLHQCKKMGASFSFQRTKKQ